jgi:hypothetical protein
VNTVINFRIPKNVGEYLSSCATGGFSIRAQLHGVSSVEMAERMLDKHAREELEKIKLSNNMFTVALTTCHTIRNIR